MTYLSSTQETRPSVSATVAERDVSRRHDTCSRATRTIGPVGVTDRSTGEHRRQEYECCVTGPQGVTVLPTLIASKFVHQKVIQKYKWIEHISTYNHKKFEIEQNFVQKETKKRNLHLNSCRLRIIREPLNPQLFKCKFLRFVSSCTKFCSTSNFA